MKILLVEDDEPTASALVAALTDDRHIVNIATDGHMGIMLAETYDYDLILLDVLIPKLDGISICRRLRSQGLQMPILLITAKDSQTDKIVGLDAGADDYVVKPFDLEELRARIRALLRRGSAPLATVLTWENLRLDPNASEVTYNDATIPLTPKEYGILELLLRNPHRVFSRSAIIDRLWAMEDSPAESAVTTHIKDLRQKLKAGGMTTDLIETVYGLGYRLKAPPSSSASEPSTSPPSTTPPSTTPAPAPARSPMPKAEGLASINRVLEKFRSSFAAQIVVLQEAEAALNRGELSSELREQARQEAHKLAGSLGIFGYPEGSKLAREAEYLLMSSITSEQVASLSQLIANLNQELAKPPQTLDSSPTSSHADSLEPASALATQTIAPQMENGSSNAIGSCALNSISLRRDRSLMLVIDQDEALTKQLQGAAAEWGIQVKVATNPKEVWHTIATTMPNLILLDPAFADGADQGLSLLAELAHQYPRLPILVSSRRNSLSDRVEVSRLGGKAFLPKPMPVQQVLQAATQALAQSDLVEAKVLIVDDDLATLTALAALLHPWGLQVTTLNNPEKFWDMLVATQPDLVLVDLEMPTFSGIDLCQVVRHDPQWGNMPILVVTAHTDADSIRKVFAAGADDFIAKPVIGPELVTRILSRLERVRSHLKLS